MPEVRAFVDKQIYDKFKAICQELSFELEADCVAQAIMLFIAFNKKCKELNKPVDECLDIILKLSEEKLKR